MFLIFILINTESQSPLSVDIESLKVMVSSHPRLTTILSLNNIYCATAAFDSAIALLTNYERNAPSEEKPQLSFSIAEDYLFAGRILDAREHYLQMVERHSRSEIANDALERLYLIEISRTDTIILKKLTQAVSYYQIAYYTAARESLKNLIITKLGDYALYYLAQVYDAQSEISLALSALDELNSKFPDHKIHKAALLAARLLMKLNNKKEARRILEALVMKLPESVYAVQARKMIEDLEQNSKK